LNRDHQTAAEALREFTHATAHGVRGRAGQVRTLLEMMLESLPCKPDEEVLGYLNSALTQLGTLADGIGACSDTLNWPYTFETVNSAEALEAALIRFGPSIESGDLVMTHVDLPSVVADSTQLANLFEHLVDNALKFRSGPAQVNVTARRDACGTVFSIRDRGIGIDLKYRDLLFRPFRKLWGEKYPGNGLGLFLSRQIVECHGGRIWLADPPAGGGIQIEFCLPDGARGGN
jgi:chemotaxis family two-component system sensor kinase Cph1